MTTDSYTADHVSAALNRAADDIIGAADLPDTGTVDALNLLVNATLTYLRNPDADLATVVASNYSSGNDDSPTLEDVLEWISGDVT